MDWRRHEEQVRRLRGRIFKAVQEGDWPLARNVQKLMLRSWSNTLVSVRQVTQRNAGRRTAGIDGLVALTSQARAEMAVQVHASIGSHQPSPVRRVYIPKASDKTKMRPLGIPVLLDRCHQARVRNALEPEWEARFEPRSYGFRPGRGCHDAIESLFNTLHGKSSRVWILDADLAGAFDKISHGHLLEVLGGFPARDMIAGWLKAGSFRGRERVRADRGGNSPGRRDHAPNAIDNPGDGHPPYRVRCRAGGCRRCLARAGMRCRMVIFSGPMRTSLTSSRSTRWRSSTVAVAALPRSWARKPSRSSASLR